MEMINTINKYINKYVNQITAISGILIALGIVFIVTGYESYKDLALIGATIIGIIPIAIRAFQALRMKVFSIELLVTIAVVGNNFAIDPGNQFSDHLSTAVFSLPS
jgi:Cd2+/Zn2+-exporting ATPase